MEVIIQFLVTLCLVLGVLLGEVLSTKAFGFNRKWYLNLIEVVLFVLGLTILLNFTYLEVYDVYLISALNFVIGFIVILITRGITTVAGLLGQRINENRAVKARITDETIISGLTRNLLNYGLTRRRITSMLGNVGFDKVKVGQVVKETPGEEKVFSGTERKN